MQFVGQLRFKVYRRYHWRLLLGVFVLVSSLDLRAASGSWIGHSQEDFVSVMGDPASKAAMGSREIWTYPGGITVHFRDGKVEKVRGNVPSPGKPGSQPPSSAPSTEAAPVVVAGGTGGFKVPAATIVTEPGFRADGNWGGLSDGKTLGADGKPLSDHQLYALDCACFDQRMYLGLKELEDANTLQRVSEIRTIIREKDASRQGQMKDHFSSRYGRPVERDPFYRFAVYAEDIQVGQYAYQAAKGQLNYIEQVKVSERIDLEGGPTPEGRKLREDIKLSIRELEKARKGWYASFRRFYEAGRRVQQSQFRSEAADEQFAEVLRDDTPLFIYQSFERTPMGHGLIEASEGRLALDAKPILLPAGQRVQVLEEKTVEAESRDSSGRTKALRVTKIRIQATGLKQHDGKILPEIRLEGWVLESAVKAVR